MNLDLPENFSHLEINDQMNDALDTIYRQKRNTILLGNSGSGKSQFIHLMKALDKINNITTLYIAPTGIAATRIEASTIHSTFRLGVHPKDPEDVYLHPDVRSILERVDKICIDEISMNRADIFDTMDALCRKAKNNDVVFGKIQLICVGDLMQLSPIIGKNKEEIFFYNDRYGGNPYFFASKAYRENAHTFYRIEFTKIYRQSDSGFKDILNRIRVGKQTDKDLEVINSKRIPYRRYKREFPEGVHIAPFNAIVAEINDKALAEITEKEYHFQARIVGNVNTKNFMAPVHLKLKKGCKLMMLVNDPAKRFQNGTMGHFERVINDKLIEIKIKGHLIEIEHYTFKEYKYKLIKGKLTQEVKSRFSQYPCTLGYSFTVHKSQSCTFHEGYVDFSYKVFADHLVYVALSRFSDFERIGLKRDLKHEDIKINPYVLEFMETFHDKIEEIPVEKKKINTNLFDTTNIGMEDDIPF